MPKRPNVESYNYLIPETVSRFLNHRPTISGEYLADPNITIDPYYPYDFEEAAAAVMLDEGFDFRLKGIIAIKSALAEAARSQVPRADEILERRQKIANDLNKLFKLEHGIN